MATFASEHSKDAVANQIRKSFRLRKGAKPHGNFVIEGDVTIAPASYDVLNDQIELIEFPANTYLRGFSIVADKEFDTGGTAFRAGVVLESGDDATSFTSAVGSAFANQPANDGVSIHSTDAGDTTQTVTIIGTTTATDTVVVEELALNGTTVVDSVKTDWGQILAVKIDAATDGDITVEEASGNADIVVITAGGTSAGVNTLTSTDFYDRLARLVASGSSTKQVGLKGTDSDGTVIYDSQALTGATSVLSNSRFQTVTELYTGDLESNRTATVSSTDALLVTGSQAFTALPIPLNWTGATNPGTEYLVDVSDQTLSLLVEAAPTTANTSNITFTVRADVYHGELTSLGDAS